MHVDLNVFDFFENVVLLLGWIVNNAIWDILNASLLAAVPFIALIVREWYAARREGEDEGNKGLLALNRIETGLYAMLVVYAFTVVPLLSLSFAPVHINQTHLKQCGVRVLGGGASASAPAGSALGGQTADIPVWWAFVHAVATGATNVALAALPCQTDYTYLRTQLDLTPIKDPKLRQQVADFQAWCYGQAKNKLLRSDTQITPKLAQDTDWIGSKYFLNTPGYYDSIHANRPTQGFAYNAARDDQRGTGPEKNGYPTCKNWWQAPTVGLRARLYKQIKPSWWQEFKGAISGSKTAENYAIRALVTTKQGGALGNGGSAVAPDQAGAASGFSGVVGKLAGALGTALAGVPALGAKDVLTRALPYVQYLALMALVIAMPFIIIIGGYGFRITGILTFAYIGLVSLSFWFGLAHWLQNNLVSLLYDSQAAQLSFVADVGNLYDQSVLELVNVAMLLVLPTFWLAMLGWAGFAVGSGLSRALTGGAGPAQNAGQKGGEKTQGVATRGVL